MTKSARPDRTLMEETEALVKGLVKQARRRVAHKEVVDGKEVTRYRLPGILDQARAVDAALKVLALKAKEPPLPVLSEFERGMKELENERDATTDSDAGNGSGTSASGNRVTH